MTGKNLETINSQAQLALAAIPKGAIAPEAVECISKFWMGLRPPQVSVAADGATAAAKLIADDDLAAVAQHTVDRMKAPASDKWLAARVSTMLLQYYASDIPAAAMEAVAGDWLHELRGKPAWAVLIAVRWWMGEDNPQRRKRPMPGDISAKATESMRIIRFLEFAIHSYHSQPARIASPQGEPASAESRARIDALVKSMFRAPASSSEGDDGE